MINPGTIDAFLARKLNSWDWMKSQELPDLDQALSELSPPPEIPNLWLHQKICFLLIEALQRFMLHIDMGGGKTVITLSILSYLKQRGKKPRAIVFVPFMTAISTWIEETAKHTPHLTCIPLTGTTAENRAVLATGEGDLLVMCYQSAVAMLSEPIKTQRKGKKKWQIRPEVTRSVFSNFSMLVMDEIHKAKSVSSLTYKMLRSISAQSQHVIGLTGTPFGKDLQDLWPQFYLVDFGETLGTTMGLFREAFFTKKKGYWGGYDFKFKKKLFGKLQQVIKNISIRYNVEEFHDMPPKDYVIKKLEAAQGIKAYAESAIAEIRQIVSRKQSQYNALESEYLRLRQLSSGFMTLKGQDDDRVQVAFDENPKLDALEELVEALPADHKMIVFHHFVYTNQIISERLTKMKVGHARVYGKTKDPINELARFKNDDTCRVLVINSKSGSSSLNLQIANYVVFFENPDSPIDRQQAERRVWRPGQEKRVWIYDLIMKDTWDSKVHKANADGRDLLKALLDGTEDV